MTLPSGIERLCVGERGTLRDAMTALDRGDKQIALVLDAEARLVGTVTDGDLRRALLKGASLEDPLAPHVQRRYVSVGPGEGRAQVLDLMQARKVHQVPVLDDERRVLGLHLLDELVGAVPRPNWAVIMAGGKGTRLRPLTEHVPKPMLTVAGRPILERLVLHLVGFGIRRVYLAVNFRREVIEEHFGDGRAFGCAIDYLREDRPLGTGGPLSLLPEPPTDPLLVMNGDLVTQPDVPGLLGFHARGGYTATVAVYRHRYTIPFGVATLDGNRLVALEEKPTIDWPVNAGIYVLAPDLPARVPRGVEHTMPALLEDCMARGERVGAFMIEGDWSDIGRADELKRARGEGIT